jgi:hypothetical protein
VAGEQLVGDDELGELIAASSAKVSESLKKVYVARAKALAKMVNAPVEKSVDAGFLALRIDKKYLQSDASNNKSINPQPQKNKSEKINPAQRE